LALPQSPVSQSQGRQLAMPSTLGTGRYPETVQFHHIMEHYIKVKNAEIARNQIDLTDDVPVATPVVATVSVPTAAQGVASIPLAVPILDSVKGSRSALPDFILEEYKVYNSYYYGRHKVQQQGTRPFKQSRKTAVSNPPFDANVFSAPIGSTMSRTQFDNLPKSVCKGGSEFKQGRGRNFVCVLCFIVGHTWEYCSTHNGFIMGGPPIKIDPLQRSSGNTLPPLSLPSPPPLPPPPPLPSPPPLPPPPPFPENSESFFFTIPCS
jgi:hypothetical protein